LIPTVDKNDPQPDLDAVKGTFKVKCNLPNMETKAVDFGVARNGDLVFNPDSPYNHRQTTMLDDYDDE
jgi:hypothetical protein